jgi:phosphoglycolate phosphatase-like HAD superfamily hydrolase
MHVCLFDIDGTLISSGGAGKAALEAALASEFGIDQLIEKLELSGRTDRAIIRDIFRMHALEETPTNRQRLIDGYLLHLPRCLATLKGRVLPGIQPLLVQLGGRPDVAVGLLTGNVRAGARVKLGHFGLYEHFTFGGFGDHHLNRDDVAREALAEVRQCLNGHCDPNRIWVIGDTPLDVQCARAIGARAVAVATGWHSHEELAEHQPDLLLTDLADPAPLLDRLQGA